MEVKEFEVMLNELKDNLKNSTAEEIKSQMAGLEEKYNEATAKASNELKEELEAKMNLIQDHADKLEAKMKETKKVDVPKGDELKGLIRENYEAISQVRKGKAVEVKAVGNMVLSTHLTGDQPRDYSMDVVMVPGQLVNVADLVGSI